MKIKIKPKICTVDTQFFFKVHEAKKNFFFDFYFFVDYNFYFIL